jgi:hypothetical protein
MRCSKTVLFTKIILILFKIATIRPCFSIQLSSILNIIYRQMAYFFVKLQCIARFTHVSDYLVNTNKNLNFTNSLRMFRDIVPLWKGMATIDLGYSTLDYWSHLGPKLGKLLEGSWGQTRTTFDPWENGVFTPKLQFFLNRQMVWRI